MKSQLAVVRLRKLVNKMDIVDSNIVKSIDDFTLSQIDGSKLICPYNNFTFDNQKIYLIVRNLKDDLTLDFTLNNNSQVILSFLADSNYKNVKINVNVHSNCSINVYFADFSNNTNTLKAEINLFDKGSSCYWHLASLSANDDNKDIEVSINHLSNNTNARVDNFGVCKDNSKLTFSGTSLIKKGSHSSKTIQNAKILVFDNGSIAKAKPILKIDENDIEASHAAIVGRVNEEHMFYLTSRGLSKIEARQLITLGYLKPILNGFKLEDDQQHILSLIEGRL